MFSTVVDHVSAHAIHRWRGQPRARRVLIAALCTNLALLGFFKYYNFGADNLTALAEWLNLPAFGLDSVLRVTLPLGISFTVFQSMSYVIDVYRGDAVPIRSFIDYACFASMYPQLVAGPIIRFSELADQLQFRTHTAAKFAHGIAFLAVGLAKKILLANPCGKVADLAFDAGSRAPLDAWYGAAAYAFQIYFDFSGYSDMAIGLGLMLGFAFPKNFDSPYRSESITEFWRRWHISLSAWLRDYLYVPLGGNRKGRVRTYVNLAIVMLLGGLWHGAAWTFVIWGALHGTLLIVERLVGKAALYRGLPAAVRVGITFIVVLFTWVFFRASDLPQAVGYLGDMLALGEPQQGAGLLAGIVYKPYYLGTFLLAGVIVWGAPQTWDWTRTLTLPKAAAVMAVFVLSVVVLATQAYNPFIYFIF
jgi:alginate O-acetyltransferase complex protein AlgI